MGDEKHEVVYVIPINELRILVEGLRKIGNDVAELKKQQEQNFSLQVGYIRPKDFMKAVGIKRTKFNSLVAQNIIKTIKKGRKLYLPVSEIQRYFTDPKIF